MVYYKYENKVEIIISFFDEKLNKEEFTMDLKFLIQELLYFVVELLKVLGYDIDVDIKKPDLD